MDHKSSKPDSSKSNVDMIEENSTCYLSSKQIRFEHTDQEKNFCYNDSWGRKIGTFGCGWYFVESHVLVIVHGKMMGVEGKNRKEVYRC